MPSEASTAALSETKPKESAAYLPIEDYAVIGNGRSAALISKDGSIDWLCWPRFDSRAVFSRILDSVSGGTMAVRPTVPFQAERHYEPGSNVLITKFITQDAAVNVTDLMVAPPAQVRRRQFLPDSLLIRKLEASRGEMQLEVTFRPVNDYMEPVEIEDRADAGLLCTLTGQRVLHLSSDVQFQIGAREAHTVISLKEGGAVTLALAYGEQSPAVFPPLAEIDELIAATDRYWREWSARCSYDGPYQDAVVRSALTLKLLQFAPSGAILAAPTTSLPERMGADYNWDYRFCWLRDASLTVRALLGLGFRDEATAFVNWLLHATRLNRPRLQVLYDVYGRQPRQESTLDAAEGYRGSRPVRIGNLAAEQQQLDVYGFVMDAVFRCVEQDIKLDRDQKAFLQDIARYVCEHWDEPDAGIWETREGDRHHTHSKVMCWVALDRAVKLAERGVLSLDAARLRSTCEQIAGLVHEAGFNRRLSCYVRTLGGDDLDASVLQFPLAGFIDANDPRMASTMDAIRRQLGRDELIFRHQSPETGGEGAFAVCSFWLVDCLARQGHLAEARRLFERLLARANDVGLYAEEFEPETGAFLGNFPLAYTHVGLVNAALTLRDRERA